MSFATGGVDSNTFLKGRFAKCDGVNQFRYMPKCRAVPDDLLDAERPMAVFMSFSVDEFRWVATRYTFIGGTCDSNRNRRSRTRISVDKLDSAVLARIRAAAIRP